MQPNQDYEQDMSVEGIADLLRKSTILHSEEVFNFTDSMMLSHIRGLMYITTTHFVFVPTDLKIDKFIVAKNEPGFSYSMGMSSFIVESVNQISGKLVKGRFMPYESSATDILTKTNPAISQFPPVMRTKDLGQFDLGEDIQENNGSNQSGNTIKEAGVTSVLGGNATNSGGMQVLGAVGAVAGAEMSFRHLEESSESWEDIITKNWKILPKKRKRRIRPLVFMPIIIITVFILLLIINP